MTRVWLCVGLLILLRSGAAQAGSFYRLNEVNAHPIQSTGDCCWGVVVQRGLQRSRWGAASCTSFSQSEQVSLGGVGGQLDSLPCLAKACGADFSPTEPPDGSLDLESLLPTDLTTSLRDMGDWTDGVWTPVPEHFSPVCSSALNDELSLLAGGNHKASRYVHAH